MSEKFMCICGKKFRYSQGLSKHKIQCHFTNEELNVTQKDTLINKLKQELLVEKTKVKFFIKKTEELKSEVDELNKLIRNQIAVKDNMLSNASNIVNKSISIIEYLAKNSKASVLKFKSKEKIIEQLKTEEQYEIAQIMISQYRNGKLHEYLGNVLIALYKENEPMQQSIWTTDVARLTYLITSEINTSRVWVTDKKGIHAKDTIIMPLLSIVKKEAQKYMKTLKGKELTQYILDDKTTLADIIKTIGDMRKRSSSELADKINNYIAGYLHFDKKNTILLFND